MQFSTETISYETFLDDYRPVKNHLNRHTAFDELMFETYGEEIEFVRSQPVGNIWTLVDGDDCSVIISGFHRVNRLGYFLTQKPVEENRIIDVRL